MSTWLKSHWKRIIQYAFFIVIALFGSVLDALSFFSHLISGTSLPAFPKFGGVSLDLVVSAIGIIGLLYLVVRDSGKANLVLNPSDRTRFSIVLVIALAFWAYCLLGWYSVMTASASAASTSSSTTTSGTGLAFWVVGGSVFGTMGAFFLTIDLVGSLQDRWKVGTLVTDFFREIVNPSPERTKAMRDFIAELYQFHSSWVNIWESAVRLRSMQPSHTEAFSALMSKLISTRATLRAEGTRSTPQLNEDIDRFLKRGGELSAYLPTMIEVSKHQKVEPLDDPIISKIIQAGNELSTLANDTIIPTLERTYRGRRRSLLGD